MPSSNIIDKYFERFIKDQICSSRHGSASEVIRYALRLIEQQEQVRQVKLSNLHIELQKSLESGASRPADAVFKAVRERIKKTTQISTAS